MELVFKRMGIEREKSTTVKIAHFSIPVGNIRFYILMFLGKHS